MTHQRAVAGWLVAIIGTAVLTVACVLLGDRIDETITALVLLLPVVAGSALAGWRSAIAIGLLAGVAYALTFLSPIGRVQLGFTRDVLIIGTFIVVAVAVGVVAGRRPASAARSDVDDVVLRAISHDLRNPLNTIRAVSTDLLSDAEVDAAQRVELLGLVATESERLDRIVGNMLSAGRVQAGVLTPQRAPEAVGALLKTAASRSERLVDRPIVTDVPADVPDVMVDAVQLDQVLANLIENAARAAPTDEPIVLQARRAGRFVRIEVHDRGPGFEPAAAARAFEPYQSGAGSTGLGLAVCKAIVEAHGGSIGIAPGPGGVVWLTVPVS